MVAQEAAQNLRVPVGGLSLANCFMPPLAMATLVPSWSGSVARGVASAWSSKRIWKAAVALIAKL